MKHFIKAQNSLEFREKTSYNLPQNTDDSFLYFQLLYRYTAVRSCFILGLRRSRSLKVIIMYQVFAKVFYGNQSQLYYVAKNPILN